LAPAAFTVIGAFSHGVAKASFERIDGLALTITDDGSGFDADGEEQEGLGLAIMRERLEPVGGTLLIHSKRGAGTRIEVTVPVVSATTSAMAPL
jgi:two-component system, NarL family, sensor histidine kinase UhpB